MTYNEAIKIYNGSRRKMAEHLGLSVQAVAHYSKAPNQSLPPARVFMIQVKNDLQITNNNQINGGNEDV
tara:strand:+ start:168 stop:374 length:207 start_codon:yes stop_codon:yes gene_type:complete